MIPLYVNNRGCVLGRISKGTTSTVCGIEFNDDGDEFSLVLVVDRFKLCQACASALRAQLDTFGYRSI